MTADRVLCDGLRLAQPEPGIYELVIARPERRNALTDEMMVMLQRTGTDLSADPATRALVLRGEGGAFCAGADMDVVRERASADAPFRWPEVMGREAELLATYEFPVVSLVDGPAVGLGMGLAISADICVVEPGGFFAEAHLALGLCPTAMCWWLPRTCGLQRAADIILTGRRVEAEEAAAIGIAARLAPPGEGRSTALMIAQAAAAMPPVMARSAKLAIKIAQDEENMQRVRRFGGSANRAARLIRRLEGPQTTA